MELHRSSGVYSGADLFFLLRSNGSGTHMPLANPSAQKLPVDVGAAAAAIPTVGMMSRVKDEANDETARLSMLTIGVSDDVPVGCEWCEDVMNVDIKIIF